MSEKTHAEIIAEMRRRHFDVWVSEFRSYADRIEEAHKREVQNALDAGGFVEASRKNKQVGDAAKLREAIETVLLAFNYGESTIVNQLPFSKLLPMLRKCVEALAAPPRNCDVGVPEERIQRWSKFCKARSKKLPPIHGFEWEDYPYESEAGK